MRYPNLEMRLLANSVLCIYTGCWLWIGKAKRRRGGAKDGAMTFRLPGRINPVNRAAHRVAYEEFRGPIPEGLEIDHRCRNPMCINPEHLEAVTPQENKARRVYSKQ